MIQLRETIKITAGSGGKTVVTVTILTIDRHRSVYSYATTQSGIPQATAVCRREAIKNLELAVAMP